MFGAPFWEYHDMERMTIQAFALYHSSQLQEVDQRVQNTSKMRNDSL